MKPDFSEFSYGFALTFELVKRGFGTMQAVPIFPNLVDEAKVGYDVKLPRYGVPLFLQFKLTHQM